MKRLFKLLLLCAGLFVAWVVWNFGLPHRYESREPMTREQAQKKTGIHLPASASNVYVATYRHWIMYTHCIRFTAPLTDCTGLAQLIAQRNGTGITDIPNANIPTIQLIGFKTGVSWFNVGQIQEGLYVSPAGSFTGECWIDSKESRFYCLITD